MRTTLWAAVDGNANPIRNVYGWSRKSAEKLLDLLSLISAVDGANIVQVRVDLYNEMLAARGWPLVPERLKTKKRPRGRRG